jgi:hypothetical protein
MIVQKERTVRAWARFDGKKGTTGACRGTPSTPQQAALFQLLTGKRDNDDATTKTNETDRPKNVHTPQNSQKPPTQPQSHNHNQLTYLSACAASRRADDFASWKRPSTSSRSALGFFKG